MTLSLSVSEHFQRFIQDCVESGRYADASDVMRAALRLLETQEKAAERDQDLFIMQNADALREAIVDDEDDLEPLFDGTGRR